MSSTAERFLKYVEFDTQSDETSKLRPSTPNQSALAMRLYAELCAMGAERPFYDEDNCCVYAHIPATEGFDDKTVGFIAHMDTSPDMSGKNVRPQIVNYLGGDIVLNEEKKIVISADDYPELNRYIGQNLIVTDGTTLLGADDKAGIAEIMNMAHILLTDPDIPHRRVAIAFTCDEEIGRGADGFDLERFDADYAFTVDGGPIGELQFENFNAAKAEINIRGLSVHTGSAKDRMKNAVRIAMEFDSLLPEAERPEFTEMYEGFYHLDSLEGDVNDAKMIYLIRDHDREQFEYRKQFLNVCSELLNFKYGDGTVNIDISDTYYNMREIIENHMEIIEMAELCMYELGIDPVIEPIRGGTDGAVLSYKGLPCPNLCTGGHNFHGIYEFCCIESMELISELLVKIAGR